MKMLQFPNLDWMIYPPVVFFPHEVSPRLRKAPFVWASPRPRGLSQGKSRRAQGGCDLCKVVHPLGHG
jgi:hypothetical protein